MSWAQQIVGDYAANFFTDYNSKVGYGYVNVEETRKFGFYDSIGTTERTVWDGAGSTNANSPATASQLQVSSSDANDTSAGTGARTVTISGLDSNYEQQSEVVTLAGQTPVVTSGTYVRCNRLMVETAGSGGQNADNIYAYTGDATDGVPDDANLIYSLITAGKNQTLQCNFTMPADRVGFLRFFGISSFGNSNAFATVRLLVRPFGGVWQTKDQLVLTRGFVTVPVAEVITPKSDIEIRAAASSGTIDVSAFMFMWMAPIRT